MANPRADGSETRRRKPRTPAGIPYAMVEALAADLHGIGADGLAALRARLHSLRRMDFPNGVSGSSGRHFDYGLADVLGVLAALELAEAYVPPAAAAAIVREGWPEIARGALAGLTDAHEAGTVTVFPNALFQALGHPGGRTGDTLHVETGGLAPPRGGGRAIEIAAGALARSAIDGLDRIDRRSAGIARGQVAQLEARFGGGEALPRPEEADGRLRSDGPYWTRAHSLVAATAGGRVAESGRRRATWQLGYLVHPAPVEAWKKRVEVHPALDDVGFAAAVATLAHRAGVRNGRVRLTAGDAERIWRRLAEMLGGEDAIAPALMRTAEAGERIAKPDGKAPRPAV